MKKIIAFFLTLIATFSLSACTADDKDTTDKNDGKDNAHEHTYEYIAYESSHFKQYTCGCPSPEIAEEHVDSNGDTVCDLCGYKPEDEKPCEHEWDDAVTETLPGGGEISRTVCSLCGEYTVEIISTPTLTKIAFTVVDYNGGYTTDYLIDFESNEIKSRGYLPYGEETPDFETLKSFTETEEAFLIEKLTACGFFTLDEVYPDPGNIIDGGGWELEVVFGDGTQKRSVGSNNSPSTVFSEAAKALYVICENGIFGYVRTEFYTPPNLSYFFSASEGEMTNYFPFGILDDYKWGYFSSEFGRLYYTNLTHNTVYFFRDTVEYTVTLSTANYNNNMDYERFSECIVKSYDYNEELTNEKTVYDGGWFTQKAIKLELNKIYLITLKFDNGDYANWTFNTKSYPVYELKEIESIIFDPKGNPIPEAVEGFYQDSDYNYSFTEMISEYVVVTYKDGTKEKVKDALANRHIKISDLDTYGIEFIKTKNNIDRIVNYTGSADAAIEIFFEDDRYVYSFPAVISQYIKVYYKGGTSECVKDALESGRISITALDWFGISYIKTKKAPELTLDKLVSLVAQYGDLLDWKHFQGYYYKEVGSGLYIREYPVDFNYKLFIGGGSTAAEPDYFYLATVDYPSEYVEIRSADLNAFLDSHAHIDTFPEPFSFSFTWGVYGISSYDSETGTLIKTRDVSNPEEYTATHVLSAWEKDYIFRLLMTLDAGSYPDEYDPGIGMSIPCRNIVITVRIGELEKTIRASGIAIYGNSPYEEGQKFLDTCDAISRILTSTDEWISLPDFAPYE